MGSTLLQPSTGTGVAVWSANKDDPGYRGSDWTASAQAYMQLALDSMHCKVDLPSYLSKQVRSIYHIHCARSVITIITLSLKPGKKPESR